MPDLDLTIARGAAPSGWDETIRSLGGTLFHTSLWAAYLARPGVEPWYILRRSGDRPVGATLALFRRSGHPLVGALVRSLSITAHPCVADRPGERVPEFLDLVERAARAEGCAELHLESWMSASSPFLPAEHGYREIERLEFTVDLTAAKETLWSAMKKDQRERVRHLEREGVTVELGAARADLTVLQSMQESTQERRSRQGLGYEIEADEAFYDRVHAKLVAPGIGRLFVARLHGEPAAAIFFHAWNGQAYSMFSGSTPEGYKLGAQTLLYWRAVEHFKAEGFTLLNRGGVAASSAVEGNPLHGLYRFKTRLGTTPVTCRSGVKVLRPGLLRLLGFIRRAAGRGTGEGDS